MNPINDYCPPLTEQIQLTFPKAEDSAVVQFLKAKIFNSMTELPTTVDRASDIAFYESVTNKTDVGDTKFLGRTHFSENRKFDYFFTPIADIGKVKVCLRREDLGSNYVATQSFITPQIHETGMNPGRIYFEENVFSTAVKPFEKLFYTIVHCFEDMCVGYNKIGDQYVSYQNPTGEFEENLFLKSWDFGNITIPLRLFHYEKPNIFRNEKPNLLEFFLAQQYKVQRCHEAGRIPHSPLFVEESPKTLDQYAIVALGTIISLVALKKAYSSIDRIYNIYQRQSELNLKQELRRVSCCLTIIVACGIFSSYYYTL